VILKDKTYLVTGAAQGIGLGICKSILEAGGKVSMIDLNEDQLNDAAFELEKKYPSATLPLIANLTEMNSFAEAIQKTHTLLGPIDGFCNSAAASRGLGPFHEYDLKDVEATLELSFTILWKALTCQVNYIDNHQVTSSIVNISSNSAIRGYAFNSIYAAAKAAVNNLTQSVAKELSGRNVRVNAISPGTINTPGVREYFKAEPNAKKYLESSVLLERIGEPEDIGDAVVFLLSQNSNYITGQIISVDGGSSIN
jgi:NAD(P)-dependent dehydrogenase (short-subunit alcohol dehydrogenase family)